MHVTENLEKVQFSETSFIKPNDFETSFKVKKQNGKIQTFATSKILKAIQKAFKSANKTLDDYTPILNDVLDHLISMQFFKNTSISDINTFSVDVIQDVVEKVLMDYDKDVAKSYILYREKRKHLRELEKNMSIDFIDQYISQQDWKVNENANTSYSLQGLQHYISTTLAEKYWLQKIYPKEISRLHTEGYVHIHDLGFISAYCVGWSLSDLLLRGFGGVPDKIESRPPSRLTSALSQLVNFMFTLQGEAAGAQAVSNFDTYLAPFIRYNKMSFQEVKKALIMFLFNMNVATRVGFQAPFTNITVDITVPNSLKDEHVIWKGEYQKETYSEFQAEMDILNKALTEAYLEGDAKKKPFAFPIPTINVTPEIFSNTIFDEYVKTASLYGLPYFANFINSDLSIDDSRSMCCRLRLDTRKIRRGGLFASNPLTGSIGVVTLNMPLIAYLSKGKNKEEFYALLDDVMYKSATSLNIKRKVVENLTDRGLYPYTYHYLKDVKDKTGKWWANHFSTIGLVGMNEACLNYLGKDITSEEGLQFSNEVLDHMLQKLDEFSEEFDSLYNLEASPAESANYRLARLSVEKHPDLITAGENEVYFTNSVHPGVSAFSDAVSLINNQKDLQSKFTGGTVLHMWTESNLSVKSIKTFLKKSFEATKIPYLSITPTYAICPEHGYIGVGKHDACPICGKPTQTWSRVVGYLRPVISWNKGKKEEFKARNTLL